MGCIVSTTGLGHSDDKELPQFVTEEDIRFVQESWLLVQQDMDNIGLIIFKRLVHLFRYTFDMVHLKSKSRKLPFFSTQKCMSLLYACFY